MTDQRLALSLPVVKRFALSAIRRQMAEINQTLQEVHCRPFPKQAFRWLSHYRHRPCKVRLEASGAVRGGLSRLAVSLFDFAFTRSISADAYGTRGGYCYDPASLWVLLICMFLDGDQEVSAFVADLHDQDKGRKYRTYAGLAEHIPDEDDLSIFQRQMGVRVNYVLHVIGQVLQALGFVTGRYLTTDGKLVPTYARYRGCNYAQAGCRCRPLAAEAIAQLQAWSDEVASSGTGERRLLMTCPRAEVVAKVKELIGQEPKVELLVLRVEVLSPGLPLAGQQLPEASQPLAALGITLPQRPGYTVKLVRSHLRPGLDEEGDKIIFSCAKVPADLGAHLGYRTDKNNPGSKERVFGRDVVVTTSNEEDLDLEIPLAATVITGGASEGEVFSSLQEEQVERFHAGHPQEHALDGAYDDEKNYAFLRARGCLPIIHYNPRREKLTPEALQERGYDQNGWPYAPCGRVMPPVGYDPLEKCVHHACFAACLVEKGRPEACCPRPEPQWGFRLTMDVADRPRLVLEKPRGTQSYEEAYNRRTAAERTNAGADQHGLEAPKVRGDLMTAVRANLSLMAVALSKTLQFIVDMTLRLRSKPPAAKPSDEERPCLHLSMQALRTILGRGWEQIYHDTS